MNSRDRMIAILNGEIPDRVGRFETYWNETLEAWPKQGFNGDLYESLGSDMGLLWCADTTLRLPIKIIEETPDYIVQWDANGVLKKEFKSESGHTPHWMEHTLKCGSDWYAHKERLLFTPDRALDIPDSDFAKFRANDQFVGLCHLGPYECAWPILGQVQMFTMMMDEPEAVANMFMTFAELEIQIFQEIISRGTNFDGVWFYEDLGYRNGTLFSPECYDQLLFPAQKKLFGFFRDIGKPVIMHSCGKIESLLPKLIEAGISAIQPLEAKCDQDIVELKELYGDKITFFGNIDVRKLSGSRDDIKEEILRKLPAAMKGGRYVFHSDHSVPPDVSYENYLYALELLNTYGRY